MEPARVRPALARVEGTGGVAAGSRLVGGVITITASEHRPQLRNREAAEARLAMRVGEAIAPPPRQRRPTKPSRGSVECRIGEKKRRAQIKRNLRADD